MKVQLRLVGLVLLALILLAMLSFIMYSHGAPTYGTKEEDGVQVAYGTVTQMTSIHGGDWHMRIDSKPYLFEFEWDTLDTPSVGDNVAIAYEWREFFCLNSVDGDDDRYYYWAPLVLDWEVAA